MHTVIRSPLTLVGVSLALVSHLSAQQADDDPQRMTLTGLSKFSVYAKVQLSRGSTLPRVDETLLRTRAEMAMRQAGISILGSGDVRDGSAAQINLQYLVIATRDKAGRETGFAASACLHAVQTVSVPRLSVGGRLVYTMVPTWRSCGMLAGDDDSYRDTILRNADEQIARFLDAWRTVNRPRPAPSSRSTPELGISASASDFPAFALPFIVDAHGGEVRASTPGKGSRFSFTIPVSAK